MTALPAYRHYILLGPHPGWRMASAVGVGLVGDTYQLDPLPGDGAAIAELAGLSERAPVAVATCAGSPVHVLCAADDRIWTAPTGCLTGAEPLPGIGGAGDDPRQFRDPQDIALLAHGAVAVADTGHGAVKLFGPSPHPLLWVREGVGAPTRLAAGGGGALLWVLDAAGRRVFALDRDGARQRTIDGFDAPTAIAARGTDLAVCDGETITLHAEGAASVVVGTVPDVRSVCFGPDGALYAGTATGLVHVFLADAPGNWRPAGVGVLGSQAVVRRLAWAGGDRLTALVTPEGGDMAEACTIATAAAFNRDGMLTSEELDSNIAHATWHRIAVDAELPDGTSIEIGTETYDTAGGTAPPDLVPPPLRLFGETRDALVQGGPGRFLTLRIRLRGNGAATPVLRSVRLWFPRAGWVEMLPAVFREDAASADFLARFLAILETSFDGFDETVDTVADLFDPRSVPVAGYSWLAAWLALPIVPEWSEAKRREVLRGAAKSYAKRGTPAGLEQLIADYADTGARVVEHFRLRRLLVLPDSAADPLAAPTGTRRLWSREAYRRFQLDRFSAVGQFALLGDPEPAMEPIAWGANTFSVFFDAEPNALADRTKRVAAVVEREKPAHAQARYHPVFARMRIGVQATLGVDTRIGEPGEAVLGRISTLGYDAILAYPRAAAGGPPSRNAAAAPRLGLDTRLS